MLSGKNRKQRLTGWEGLHATIVVPKVTKQIFAFEEPGKNVVWLGAGVAWHWLKDGSTLSAKRLGTRYGLIDLDLTYNEATLTVTVVITPHRKQQVMPKLIVAVRDRDSKGILSAKTATGQDLEVEAERDLIIFDNVTGQQTLTVQLRK